MYVFISSAREPKWLPPWKCDVSGWRFAQPARISSDVYLHDARCCEIVMLWTEVLEKLWDIDLPNTIVINRPQPCGLLKMGRPLCRGKIWCRPEVLHKWHREDELTFPITISQMFVCSSLSQRVVFSNPWASTPGLQRDGVIVARLILEKWKLWCKILLLPRSFSRIAFPLRNASLAAPLPSQQQVRLRLLRKDSHVIVFLPLSCTVFPG